MPKKASPTGTLRAKTDRTVVNVYCTLDEKAELVKKAKLDGNRNLSNYLLNAGLKKRVMVDSQESPPVQASA